MERYRIRDAVHGFIRLNPLELAIINSRPFQRLRHIRQLAFTYFAYPSAEHSRFSHSLGVMAFSSKIFDALTIKHKEIFTQQLKWKSDDFQRNRQLLRLASLLHDIGHPPFSHASEDLFPNDQQHEDYTRRIILESEIQQIIDEFKEGIDIKSQDVANYFDKLGSIQRDIQLLKPIFAGEVDSDKMDYLLRDSLFSGVTYGKYDHERLIDSFCLIESPSSGGGSNIIAIEEGGVHALEGLILARYFMFTQVYYHKVARAYHLHLSESLKELSFKYPNKIEDFLEWDDYRMTTFLRENNVNNHASRILNRQHFKLAYHSNEHIDKVEYKRCKKMESAILKHFQGKPVLCDYAEKAAHHFTQVNFYVRCDNGKDEQIVDKSGIIKRLEDIDQFRVYCDQTIRNEVETFCQNFG